MKGSRIRVRPTRLFYSLLFAALVLFGIGTNVQAGWLLVLTALVVGAVFAGTILPVFALRGVEVARRAPDEATSNSPVRVSILVRNAARSLRGLALVTDRYLGEGTAVVGRLLPGQERQFAGSREGGRRGRHTSGRVEVRSGAPFGVAIARRSFDVPGDTIVFPKIVEVAPASLPGQAADGDALPRRAPVGDAAGVREYRPGDPLRHVHWRSSARTGALVVREFEEDAGADVLVVADTDCTGDTLEAVAVAATSYALAALRDGRTVRVLWGEAGRVRTLDAAAERTVLEWGAVLPAQGGVELSLVLDACPEADAIVCVLDGRRRSGAARLADAARSLGVLAVVVGDADVRGGSAADAVAVLSGVGARTIVVPPTEDLEPWLPSVAS